MTRIFGLLLFQCKTVVFYYLAVKMATCTVINCSNSSGRRSEGDKGEVKFASFPKDQKLFRTWLTRCARKDSKSVEPSSNIVRTCGSAQCILRIATSLIPVNGRRWEQLPHNNEVSWPSSSVILKKDESIDKKVTWTLARTRVWICIRWLNCRLTEEAAERRARQQVLQHSQSRR